jgi:hypothetical protein
VDVIKTNIIKVAAIGFEPTIKEKEAESKSCPFIIW